MKYLSILPFLFFVNTLLGQVFEKPLYPIVFGKHYPSDAAMIIMQRDCGHMVCGSQCFKNSIARDKQKGKLICKGCGEFKKGDRCMNYDCFNHTFNYVSLFFDFKIGRQKTSVSEGDKIWYTEELIINFDTMKIVFQEIMPDGSLRNDRGYLIINSKIFSNPFWMTRTERIFTIVDESNNQIENIFSYKEFKWK